MAAAAAGSRALRVHGETAEPGPYVSLDELTHRLQLDPSRADGARAAAARFRFRLTRFYADRILNGTLDDVLLGLVLPSEEEFGALAESWDSGPSTADSVLQHPLWVQKYPHEGLIRASTACSSYCRYCYIRERTAERDSVREPDLEEIFGALSKPRGDAIAEVILSGGDPLTLTPRMLRAIGSHVASCNSARKERGVLPLLVGVHTREPVWRPNHFLSRWDDYGPAFAALGAWVYVLHIVHPREVTSELEELVARLARCGERTPAFLVQHPIFRGVNDDADVLISMYRRLSAGAVTVRPYYVVHPFGSGTPPRYRLGLAQSQRVLQQVHAHPGRFTPTLIVPTEAGKCYVSPYQPLIRGEAAGTWILTTKTGETVVYRDDPMPDWP